MDRIDWFEISNLLIDNIYLVMIGCSWIDTQVVVSSIYHLLDTL